ncbi:DUF2188 domain-containing protein, partial [Mycobacterium tuberculosis]|nr:DUF2188 domain-containing protein [Mycobacterium tuberculosis]
RPPLSYAIVEHDGGWAYRFGETLSETFPSRQAASDAAGAAAARQQVPADVESTAADAFKTGR